MIPILKNTQLFAGVKDEDIASMLNCLNASLKTYQRGYYVYRQGESFSDVAILIEGKLHIQRDDYWGNSNILSAVEAGELFGEAYAAPDGGAMLHNVIAVEDSEVLFLDITRILTACSSACRYHTAVIQNLFFAISGKNRQLVRKLGHMSRRTTREKLMSYLSEESKRQNSPSFAIPFNRQQLSDFLSVDRSALSRELCKMRDDGLIRFEKNRFTLIQR
ncbi:MAG: Crp/Fnr family transcriptional regulator [Clostridiales bacterium]|nr:Crp/Fnr family transcriptional regulator [Clostridiales bacterium]